MARCRRQAHLLGDDLTSRGPPARGPARRWTRADADPGAAAAAAMAAAYMLDRRLDEAIATASGLALGAAGDHATALDTAATLGSVLIFVGRMDQGWAMLEAVVAGAAAASLEAEAARAYRMIGSCARSWSSRPRRALAGARARLRRAGRDVEPPPLHGRPPGPRPVGLGHWERRPDGGAALADGRGGITTRITALHVLDYLAMGRGECDLRAARRPGPGRAHGGAAALLAPLVGPGRDRAAARRPRHRRRPERARAAASARVGDAAYLFPFLTRAAARLASRSTAPSG